MSLLKNLLIALCILILLTGIVSIFLPSEIDITIYKKIRCNKELIINQLTNEAKIKEWHFWLNKKRKAERKIVQDISAPHDRIQHILYGDGKIYYKEFIVMGNTPDDTSIIFHFYSSPTHNPVKRYLNAYIEPLLEKEIVESLVNLESDCMH